MNSWTLAVGVGAVVVVAEAEASCLPEHTIKGKLQITASLSP